MHNMLVKAEKSFAAQWNMGITVIHRMNPPIFCLKYFYIVHNSVEFFIIYYLKDYTTKRNSISLLYLSSILKNFLITSDGY